MASIYKITNSVNGKFYVGKTEHTIEFRMKSHINSANKPKSALQKAINKYGAQAFSIELLVECDILELNDMERKFIAELSPHYNMTAGGDGGSTTHNKKWITDGEVDVYIEMGVAVPPGWRYGRSNCVFNDSEKQKEFNKRVDRVACGIKVSEGFASGRLTTSEAEIERRRKQATINSPSKSAEARKKISESTKRRMALLKEQGINPMEAAHKALQRKRCGNTENCKDHDQNIRRQTE